MNYSSKIFRIILSSVIILILCSTQFYAQSILDPSAEVEEIAAGILQPEGPVWSDSLGLLFSDIKDNKIYRWTAETGMEIFIDPSDSTNGLTYDSEGRLLAGQMGLRRIVRFEHDGTQTPLAERYEGKRFSSPNDLVVKSDGSVWFTDPDFNIPKGQQKEMEFNGIYRISPTGNIQHLATLTLPNGICFSPDESKLYVNDSQAHKIYVWDVIDDSTITNKQLFYTIPVFGYADGMKIDNDGNLYATCSSAVWVISPDGELLGKINLPGNVSASNCAWGDEDGMTLFITAGSSVFKVRPLLTNIEKQGQLIPSELKLFQNYPNPFNPVTTIKYSITLNEKRQTSNIKSEKGEGRNVTLSVFDMLGREVTILVNENQKPGNYEITWDGLSASGRQLPSGVYYYRLQVGNFTQTRSLVLLK